MVVRRAARSRKGKKNRFPVPTRSPTLESSMNGGNGDGSSGGNSCYGCRVSVFPRPGTGFELNAPSASSATW